MASMRRRGFIQRLAGVPLVGTALATAAQQAQRFMPLRPGEIVCADEATAQAMREAIADGRVIASSVRVEPEYWLWVQRVSSTSQELLSRGRTYLGQQ